jgi:hypothetical protein
MILFWYIQLFLLLRGIQDAWLRGIEHTYRDNLCPDYDKKLIDKISTASSYAEFSSWYLFAGWLFSFLCVDFWQWLINVSILAVLQLLLGTEDVYHYLAEPIFQHPKREIRYPVKFWIWRFPEDLHWIGAGDNQGHSGWHNPVLMFFCGKEVRLKPFLITVFISNLLVFIASLLWR